MKFVKRAMLIVAAFFSVIKMIFSLENLHSNLVAKSFFGISVFIFPEFCSDADGFNLGKLFQLRKFKCHRIV